MNAMVNSIMRHYLHQHRQWADGHLLVCAATTSNDIATDSKPSSYETSQCPNWKHIKLARLSRESTRIRAQSVVAGGQCVTGAIRDGVVLI